MSLVIDLFDVCNTEVGEVAVDEWPDLVEFRFRFWRQVAVAEFGDYLAEFL